jgi:hypothetical protein
MEKIVEKMGRAESVKHRRDEVKDLYSMAEIERMKVKYQSRLNQQMAPNFSQSTRNSKQARS